MHFINAASLNINKTMSVVMGWNKKEKTVFVYALFKRNKLSNIFFIEKIGIHA